MKGSNVSIAGLLLVVLLLLHVWAPPAAKAEELSVNGSLFADREFTDRRKSFLPMERIYLVLDFSFVTPGKYDLTADWITPWGTLERQSSYSFTIDSFSPYYQTYFWLELTKKGSLSRIISGSDYNEKHYGEWTVRVFLNGRDIVEEHFLIQ